MSNDIGFEAPQEPKAILVVEDDAPDGALIEKKIKDLWPNCAVTLVRTLLAAQKAIKVRTFDMVLLDLNLPDGFGPNSVKEMRRFNAHVPIIVMTGMLTPITEDESLKLGANHIIPKSQIMDEGFSSMLEGHVVV